MRGGKAGAYRRIDSGPVDAAAEHAIEGVAELMCDRHGAAGAQGNRAFFNDEKSRGRRRPGVDAEPGERAREFAVMRAARQRNDVYASLNRELQGVRSEACKCIDDCALGRMRARAGDQPACESVRIVFHSRIIALAYCRFVYEG